VPVRRDVPGGGEAVPEAAQQRGEARARVAREERGQRGAVVQQEGPVAAQQLRGEEGWRADVARGVLELWGGRGGRWGCFLGWEAGEVGGLAVLV
jgi:hypothetical protein